MDINIIFILSSFLAGLLTFLAPCSLPLIPAYLGFISGVNQDELKDPVRSKAAKRKILLNGVFFVLGFSIVFILLGALFGLIGSALVPYKIWLARVGGVFVIILGLFMLGFFSIPFFQKIKIIPIPKIMTLGKPLGSFFIGGTFALGWTPCIGPMLGTILLLAGTSGTVFQGSFLLAVFSFGLAIPFILIALAFSKSMVYIESISKYLRVVSIIGGVFLLLIGFLLVTNNFGVVIEYGYKWFDFINYEKILNYL